MSYGHKKTSDTSRELPGQPMRGVWLLFPLFMWPAERGGNLLMISLCVGLLLTVVVGASRFELLAFTVSR